VGSSEHAKGDQHGNQHRRRGDVVDHAGGQVNEVFAHRDQRRSVADDVAEQLKEGKDQQQQNETDQHHGKGSEKLAQHVLIENERETSPFVYLAFSLGALSSGAEESHALQFAGNGGEL